ncbi:MAG: tyrosine-type recombinase/integrase [Chitinophagaceae bacterium]
MNAPLSSILQFLEFLRYEKRYSQHTSISYENDLQQFQTYLAQTYAQSDPLQAQAIHIRSWMANLKSEGQTSRSIVRKLSTLRSFFKYHLKQGHIVATPTAEINAPRIRKRLPEFVKQEESRQLLDTLARSTENWRSLNARLIITLLYTTGMRTSELLALKTRQVDRSRQQIKVLGKGNKERVIPIHPELASLVHDYLAARKEAGIDEADNLLVTEKGRPLYAKYVYLIVREYLSQSSTIDKKSPHILRHSFATHLLNEGADLNAVKELLGHASLAATQVYTHNSIEKLKDAHRKAHPRG